MSTATFEHLRNIDFRPARKQLELVLRLPGMRVVTLIGVHLSGCLLVIAAPLATLGTTGLAFSLLARTQGPLDLFLFTGLLGLATLGGYLCVQLQRLQAGVPGGVAVPAAAAPRLFASLTHRVKHFRLRRIHAVLLTDKPELRIVAWPRLPLPLLHRYYVCVGAPLTFFFSPSQFTLALAAAADAAAKSQSTVRGRLLQANDDWRLILGALQTSDTLLTRLLNRPLTAIAAVADRLSGPLKTDWRLDQGRWLREHSNESHAADYLASQIVAAEFMNKLYWPMMLKGAERCPAPVVKAFSHLPMLLEKRLSPSLAERWLLRAQGASGADCAVRDLLAELRIDQLTWRGLPRPGVFNKLFKSADILKQLDSWWQQQIEPQWRKRHADFQEDLARFKQLHKRARENKLRGDAALRYIKLCAAFLKPTEALTAYARVGDGNRDDAKVCFAAGLALLRTGGGERGVQALQRAADLEPALTNRTQALIHQHRKSWAEDGRQRQFASKTA